MDMLRKTYRFSHSIFKGGYLYAHKVLLGGRIENKEVLRKVLRAFAEKFELIDSTIKIYDNIFFFFFMMKPTTSSGDLIEELQGVVEDYGDWSDRYLYTSVYDLQEEYVRKELSGFGFSYDEG